MSDTNGHASATLSEDTLRERYVALEAMHESLAEQYESAMSESLADLELAMEDVGWHRMRASVREQFTRPGLDNIVDNARLMFLKNPLIRRGVLVQSYYVFGQGVQIKARTPEVDAIVQDFVNSRKNMDELFGPASMTETEQALQTDGNLFFGLWTDPVDGTVTVRSFEVHEMRDILSDPEDAGDRWYYRREWTSQPLDPTTGRLGAPEHKVAYYPDWRIFFEGPTGADGTRGSHPSQIDGHPVVTDCAVMHVKVGGLKHWDFGVPDVYAALDWAKAYKEFLEDLRSIWKSLARFAWKMTGKGKNVGRLASALNTTVSSGDLAERNPAPTAGSVAVVDPGAGVDLSPIPKTGAAMSAEDGRAFRLMAAAALDLPDTILSNDPQQGALATAKTLDRPTELAMRDRQKLWDGVFTDMCNFALQANRQAVRGDMRPDDALDETIEVTFPPILEQDVVEAIKAVVSAATLDGKTQAGTIPKEILTSLLLVLIGVDDVEEVVEKMTAEGEFDEDEPDAPPPTTPEEKVAVVEVLRGLADEVRSRLNESAHPAVQHMQLLETPSEDAIAAGGCMVAWYPGAELANQLVVPNGEPREQLHLTLAFLGDDLSDFQVESVRTCVEQFAARRRPIAGHVAGIGRFVGTDPEPVWVSVDVPGLEELRSALVSELRWGCDLNASTEHGFTPHITLAWVPSGQAAPISDITTDDFMVDALTVTHGAQKWTYQMGIDVKAGALY